MKLLKCPVCKTSTITQYMGAQFGKYFCKKCEYVGALVLEEDGKKGRKKRK